MALESSMWSVAGEEELESQRVLKLVVVEDFGEGNRNKNVIL
jgi:hypothetical protein